LATNATLDECLILRLFADWHCLKLLSIVYESVVDGCIMVLMLYPFTELWLALIPNKRGFMSSSNEASKSMSLGRDFKYSIVYSKEKYCRIND